jgi:hypothetical protein
LPLKVAVSDAPGTEGEELQLDGPLQMTLDVPSQTTLAACADCMVRRLARGTTRTRAQMRRKREECGDVAFIGSRVM